MLLSLLRTGPTWRIFLTVCFKSKTQATHSWKHLWFLSWLTNRWITQKKCSNLEARFCFLSLLIFKNKSNLKKSLPFFLRKKHDRDHQKENTDLFSTAFSWKMVLWWLNHFNRQKRRCTSEWQKYKTNDDSLVYDHHCRNTKHHNISILLEVKWEQLNPFSKASSGSRGKTTNQTNTNKIQQHT